MSTAPALRLRNCWRCCVVYCAICSGRYGLCATGLDPRRGGGARACIPRSGALRHVYDRRSMTDSLLTVVGWCVAYISCWAGVQPPVARGAASLLSLSMAAGDATDQQSVSPCSSATWILQSRTRAFLLPGTSP